MSRTIRPFIADAIAAYLKPLPTMPSVQVIGFEDMPVADSEDTQRRVYSVAHSNPLAIVVDEFAFVGSEGCLAFGDPIYCMQNETVARLAATYCSVARVIPDSEQEDSAALVTELVDIMSHISPPPQTEENVADLDAYSPYPGGVYRSSIISSRQKQMLKAASAWFPQTIGAGEHAPVSLQSSPAQSTAPYKISSTSPILTKSLSKTPQDVPSCKVSSRLFESETPCNGEEEGQPSITEQMVQKRFDFLDWYLLDAKTMKPIVF
eukprot:gene8286-33009_t